MHAEDDANGSECDQRLLAHCRAVVVPPDAFNAFFFVHVQAPKLHAPSLAGAIQQINR